MVLRVIWFLVAWLTIPLDMFRWHGRNYARVVLSYCFWSLVGIAVPPLAAAVLVLAVRDFRKAGRDMEKARGLNLPRAQQTRARAKWASAFACVCLVIGVGLWVLAACGVVHLGKLTSWSRP